MDLGTAILILLRHWTALKKQMAYEDDFFDHVEFNWDIDKYEARLAARKYSEQTTSDY